MDIEQKVAEVCLRTVRRFFELKRRIVEAASEKERKALLAERALMLPDVGLATLKLKVILGEFNARYLIGEAAEQAMMDASVPVGITYNHGYRRVA